MLIGFIGAPGCGKSTTAFGLCYHLKKSGFAVEFFAEYARRHIIECRVAGTPRQGGHDGQTIIYQHDCDDAAFYRQHANAITITDGSTVNCYFYGFNHLDLDAEIQRYDVLFYIPMIKAFPIAKDANRMQEASELLAMGHRWDQIIQPLLVKHSTIVILPGYPDANAQEMTAMALDIVQSKIKHDHA